MFLELRQVHGSVDADPALVAHHPLDNLLVTLVHALVGSQVFIHAHHQLIHRLPHEYLSRGTEGAGDLLQGDGQENVPVKHWSSHAMDVREMGQNIVVEMKGLCFRVTDPALEAFFLVDHVQMTWKILEVLVAEEARVIRTTPTGHCVSVI